jgi:hypothetical protein
MQFLAFRTILIVIVLTIAPISFSHADTLPGLTNNQMLLALESARQDAIALAETGVICDSVGGIRDLERFLNCAIIDVRGDHAQYFVTTRCYYLCDNGFHQQGNFCQWPLTADSIDSTQGYCDN